jgi:hypothetical protein
VFLNAFDLEFSYKYFSEKECALIDEEIGQIVDTLRDQFLEPYQESLMLQPTRRIGIHRLLI